jgi:hypothetical protein
MISYFMTSYLIKWLVASSIMPIMVILIGKSLSDTFVLIFWPGAIVLMSLGAEKRPLMDVLYTWGIAVGLNIMLYIFVGLMIYYLRRLVNS